MKFQLKDLKSKKAITIIIIVIALIAGFTIYHKHAEQNFLKDYQITYSGYTGYGEANVSDSVTLSTYKKVARYEAKKAHFSSSAIKTIINSATNYRMLYTGDTFYKMSLTDPYDAKVYAEHMENTTLTVSKNMGLSNGEKITATLADKSPDPYFEPKFKSFTVSGVKKTKVIAVKDFQKYLYCDGDGNNHHSEINIRVKKSSGVKLDDPNLSQLNRPFKVKYGKVYSNGDKFTISETALAKELTSEAYQNNVKFVGRPNKKITVTVSGLKEANQDVSNIKEVSEKALADFYDSYSTDDDLTVHLVRASYEPGEDGEQLTMVYKASKGKTNTYLVSKFDCKLKNHVLMYKNKPLQDTEIFGSGDTTPTPEDSLNDKNWDNLDDQDKNTIDINI